MQSFAKVEEIENRLKKCESSIQQSFAKVEEIKTGLKECESSIQ